MFPPRPVDQDVGAARGLREPQTPKAAQDEADGALLIDPVAGGDEDGLHTLPRAEGGSDGSALQPESPSRADPVGGLPVFPNQAALRTADGGDAEEETDVGGEAQTARVGGPLAVEDDGVRRMAKPPEGLQEEGGFPKTQEAGNVGEFHTVDGHGLLHHLHGGEAQNANPAKEEVPPLEVGGVRSRDETGEVSERLDAESSSEALL